MVMMMCGGNKKGVLSCRNAGNLHTHTHTHTPISVAEKIFVIIKFDKIICIGYSGGGTIATYLSALDNSLLLLHVHGSC